MQGTLFVCVALCYAVSTLSVPLWLKILIACTPLVLLAPEITYCLGYILPRKSQLKVALFRLTIAIDRNYAKISYNPFALGLPSHLAGLGSALIQLGKNDQAEIELKQAVEKFDEYYGENNSESTDVLIHYLLPRQAGKMSFICLV